LRLPNVVIRGGRLRLRLLPFRPLLGLALGLTITPMVVILFALYANLAGGRIHYSDATYPSVLYPTRAMIGGDPEKSFAAHNPTLGTVILRLNELQPGERFVNASVQAQIGTSLARTILDIQSHKHIGRVLGNLFQLDPADARQTLSLTISGKVPSFYTTASIPLSTAFPQYPPFESSINPLLVYPASVNLPLEWDAEHYPNDSFILNMDAMLQFPTHLTGPAGGLIGGLAVFQSGGGFTWDLPTTIVVVQPDDQTFPSMHVTISSSYSSSLVLHIERDGVIAWYTYAITAVPFFLAVIIWWLFRFHPPKDDSPFGLVVGLAAAMFTIIPLRAVLIPSDVQGLTRVDILLGLSLSLFLVVAVLPILGEIGHPRLTHRK